MEIQQFLTLSLLFVEIQWFSRFFFEKKKKDLVFHRDLSHVVRSFFRNLKMLLITLLKDVSILSRLGIWNLKSVLKKFFYLHMNDFFFCEMTYSQGGKILSYRIFFLWNQLIGNFFSKNVAFMKFLTKKCEREFP